MTVPLCCYKTVNCGWGLSDDQLLHCFPPDEDEKEKKDDPANKVGEKIEGYPAIFVPNLKWVGLVELDAGAVWRSNSHWGDSCALCKAHQIFHCLLLFNHFSSLSCRLLNKMTHWSQPIASEEGRVVLFSACQTHSRCSLALSVVRPMPRWDTCATHHQPSRATLPVPPSAGCGAISWSFCSTAIASTAALSNGAAEAPALHASPLDLLSLILKKQRLLISYLVGLISRPSDIEEQQKGIMIYFSYVRNKTSRFYTYIYFHRNGTHEIGLTIMIQCN